MIKTSRNCIIGGDFNTFHNSWGSNYNDVRGLLLINELESFCLLNDGSPTRIPSKNSKANPLDLSWASSDILERMEWNVKMETLGSDHLVVLMEITMAMNSEEIKVKPKIDYKVFMDKIEELDVQNVKSLADFILAIDGAKVEATTRPQILRNPKHIPKPYWNEEIRKLHQQKKSATIKYFRHMTTENWIECKRLNALFKRRLKRER